MSGEIRWSFIGACPCKKGARIESWAETKYWFRCSECGQESESSDDYEQAKRNFKTLCEHTRKRLEGDKE